MDRSRFIILISTAWNVREALEIGAEEYFYGDGVSIIEWPERVGPSCPATLSEIHITSINNTTRKITEYLTVLSVELNPDGNEKATTFIQTGPAPGYFTLPPACHNTSFSSVTWFTTALRPSTTASVKLWIRAKNTASSTFGDRPAWHTKRCVCQ